MSVLFGCLICSVPPFPLSNSNSNNSPSKFEMSNMHLSTFYKYIHANPTNEDIRILITNSICCHKSDISIQSKWHLFKVISSTFSISSFFIPYFVCGHYMDKNLDSSIQFIGIWNIFLFLYVYIYSFFKMYKF